MNFFYNNTGKTATDANGKTVAEYTLYKNPEGKTAFVPLRLSRYPSNRASLMVEATIKCKVGKAGVK